MKAVRFARRAMISSLICAHLRHLRIEIYGLPALTRWPGRSL